MSDFHRAVYSSICWPSSLFWITGTLCGPSARTMQHHSLTLLSVTSTPSACVCTSSRWCVCVYVCEGWGCGVIWMGAYTTICLSVCYYCHMIITLFYHQYFTHLHYMSTFNFPLSCIINWNYVCRIQPGSFWSHCTLSVLLFDTRRYTDEG